MDNPEILATRHRTKTSNFLKNKQTMKTQTDKQKKQTNKQNINEK
jgi:hypothetical protein